MTSEFKVKLHLGCGKRFIPGFIHVDLSDFSHIDYKQDIRDLSFVNDNSVDLIYACHVFEYFGKDEAMKVLREWKRVLKPGGILRICVPDFEQLLSVYMKDRESLSFISGVIYGEWDIGRFNIIHHRMCYDFFLLAKILSAAGFIKIKRYDWRNTEHADIDDYSQAYVPHMDKENGTLISLNVEAIKQ